MKKVIPFGLGFLAGVLYMRYRIKQMTPFPVTEPSLPPNNSGYTPLPPESPAVVPSFPVLPAPTNYPTKPLDTWSATNDAGAWEGAQVNGVPRRGWDYQSRGNSVPFGSYLPPNA